VFKQKKYGLEKEYIATIGGLFNKGETALACAKRELLEETGLEAEEWVNLGRYRVQGKSYIGCCYHLSFLSAMYFCVCCMYAVNRGGGILHAFFAKNSKLSKGKNLSNFENDYEKQKPLKLTRKVRAFHRLYVDLAQTVLLLPFAITPFLFTGAHQCSIVGRGGRSTVGCNSSTITTIRGTPVRNLLINIILA